MNLIHINDLKVSTPVSRFRAVAPLLVSVRKHFNKAKTNHSLIVSIRLSKSLLNDSGFAVGDRVDIFVDQEREQWVIKKAEQGGLLIGKDGESGHGRVSFTMRPGLGIAQQEAEATALPVVFDQGLLVIELNAPEEEQAEEVSEQVAEAA